MKKRGITVLTLVLLLSLFSVSATSIDSEIQKLTNYAQEYETGNINYVQFLVYSSAVREKMNEVLGATGKEMGGHVEEEQLKSVLGEPSEKTRWVWVENEQREENMQRDIPAWRKIVFDGKKIQLWLSAWPNIILKDDEEKLFYNLNVEVQFKKPSEQLDISSKISEIKTLAEIFNKDPSTENAEAVAQKSVSTERIFESFLRQNQGKCEDVMRSIFGSENRRDSEKTIVQEIEFFSGENFVVNARLEMCDECEWHWVNLDFWFEGRGPGFKQLKSEPEMVSSKEFMNLGSGEFRNEILNMAEKIKRGLEAGDYKIVMEMQSRVRALNEAWNQKSNDVWRDVDKTYEEKRKEMSQEEQQEYNQNYGWIRDEQEKRRQVQEIANKNYQERKEFYLSLFSEYEKREFYFTQEQYEKRLIEEFKEFGEEICNNNMDDNTNEKIDCDDEQCSGKICGRESVRESVMEGNETIEREVVRDLYCIAGTCQAREEVIEKREIVCGNHICEENETESCSEDCSICERHDAVNCSGNVIFGGRDEKGCSLKPICIEENTTCVTTDDCLQPLCGRAECVDLVCKTIEISECRETECIDGEERIKNCDNGDSVVFDKCIEGLWRNTGMECEVEEIVTSCAEYCETMPHLDCVGHMESGGVFPDCNCNMICEAETETKNECLVREDCGNEDDVCNNGECVTIPRAIELEEPDEFVEREEEELESGGLGEEEIQEQPQTEEGEQAGEQQETQQEPVQETLQQEQTIAGQMIRTIKSVTGSFMGLVVFLTGSDTAEIVIQEPAQERPVQETLQQEQPQTEEGEQAGEQQETQQEPVQETREETQEQTQQEQPQQEMRQENREEEERARREKEERERQERDCRQGCESQCRDMLIAPCVEKCVRDKECEDEECTNSKIEECEASCKQEKNYEGCINDCGDKCVSGEGFKIDEKREEPKMEKGVFKVGGVCRSAQGQQKTEGFVYFDGWGDPFEEIRDYKQKYYNGGQAEWCKDDLENLIKQRKEFEIGFNEEFVRWFFEKYLANSADDWEQHVSGIFELYWKDVENSKQMAERLDCLEMQNLPEHNLVNIMYETEFGKIEFWEEVKTARLPGIGKEVQVISPYMKIWIFPPREFIIHEMKEAMKNREFPGPSEEKMERENEEGLTAEEREGIKQDEKFMKRIKKIIENYGGEMNVAVKFMEHETNTVVFNLYVQVNEDDIMKIEPMLPEEVPEKDVEIELDFERLYDIIYMSEKEMQGERIESPPWDKQTRPVGMVKEFVDGIKMYFKVRSMMNSARITPEESEGDVRYLMKTFFSMMMEEGKGEGDMSEGEGDGGEEDMGEEKGVWDEKGKITGESVLR